MSVADPAPFSQPNEVVFTPGRWTRLSGLTPAQAALVRAHLTMVNPRRAARARYTGWVDPSIPKHLLGYQDVEQALLIAPGASATVWRLLQDEGANPRHSLAGMTRPEEHGLAYAGQQRSYQESVANAMLQHRFAMAVGPCGSGKTDAGIRVMVARACRWLVIVEKRELRDQWAARIHERTGVAPCIYSSTRKRRFDPDNPFIVATVQALVRHPEDVYAMDETRGGVLVDECHHTPASTFTDVLALMAPVYRYGFTATPDRADGTTALMYWWIGPEVARVEREDVEASGHLLRPRLMVRASPFVDTYDPAEPGDSQRLLGRLREDAPRLELVVSTVQRLAGWGRTVLVCCDSIAYGEAIERELVLRGVRALFCNGQLAKRRRRDIIECVARGLIPVLIATSLADEGLDLPILDTVVLATPSGSATRTEQRMGRACRPLAGKREPWVVDIVDPLVARVEERVDPNTGERTRKTHRIFLNQFRTRFHRVFRKMSNCDEFGVRRLMKGDFACDISFPREAT